MFKSVPTQKCDSEYHYDFGRQKEGAKRWIQFVLIDCLELNSEKFKTAVLSRDDLKLYVTYVLFKTPLAFPHKNSISPVAVFCCFQLIPPQSGSPKSPISTPPTFKTKYVLREI